MVPTVVWFGCAAIIMLPGAAVRVFVIIGTAVLAAVVVLVSIFPIVLVRFATTLPALIAVTSFPRLLSIVIIHFTIPEFC